MPKLISINQKQEIRPWDLSEKAKKERMKRIANNEEQRIGTIYITAQLSRNQYASIVNDEAELIIPSGVDMLNRKGSKILEFTCQDELVAEELIDGLDNSGITWQEEFSSEDVGISDILENNF